MSETAERKIALGMGSASDIPAIVRMGRCFYAASGYGDLATYDEASVWKLVAQMIAGDDSDVILLRGGDCVVGLLGVVVTPLYFNPTVRVAAELFWWVDGAYRKGRASLLLVRACEDWAAAHDCDLVALSAIEALSADRLDGFYRRRGYMPAERSYVRSVDQRSTARNFSIKQQRNSHDGNN